MSMSSGGGGSGAADRFEAEVFAPAKDGVVDAVTGGQAGGSSKGLQFSADGGFFSAGEAGSTGGNDRPKKEKSLSSFLARKPPLPSTAKPRSAKQAGSRLPTARSAGPRSLGTAQEFGLVRKPGSKDSVSSDDTRRWTRCVHRFTKLRGKIMEAWRYHADIKTQLSFCRDELAEFMATAQNAERAISASLPDPPPVSQAFTFGAPGGEPVNLDALFTQTQQFVDLLHPTASANLQRPPPPLLAGIPPEYTTGNSFPASSSRAFGGTSSKTGGAATAGPGSSDAGKQQQPLAHAATWTGQYAGPPGGARAPRENGFGSMFDDHDIGPQELFQFGAQQVGGPTDGFSPTEEQRYGQGKLLVGTGPAMSSSAMPPLGGSYVVHGSYEAVRLDVAHVERLPVAPTRPMSSVLPPEPAFVAERFGDLMREAVPGSSGTAGARDVGDAGKLAGRGAGPEARPAASPGGIDEERIEDRPPKETLADKARRAGCDGGVLAVLESQDLKAVRSWLDAEHGGVEEGSLAFVREHVAQLERLREVRHALSKGLRTRAIAQLKDALQLAATLDDASSLREELVKARAALGTEEMDRSAAEGLRAVIQETRERFLTPAGTIVAGDQSLSVLSLPELQRLGEKLRVCADFSVIHIVEDVNGDIPTVRDLLAQVDATVKLRAAAERVRTGSSFAGPADELGAATSSGAGGTVSGPGAAAQTKETPAPAATLTPTRPLAGAMSFRQQQKLMSGLEIATPASEDAARERSIRQLSYLLENLQGKIPAHELAAGAALLGKIQDGAREDAKRLLMVVGRSPTNKQRLDESSGRGGLVGVGGKAGEESAGTDSQPVV
eukprot:g75.t1